jgi:hypothetical protein
MNRALRLVRDESGMTNVYISPESKASYTGYDVERDKGTTILLKADNASKIAPSFYQAWSINGFRGAAEYR